MSKAREIPFSKMRKMSDYGAFIKRFGHHGGTTMKPYAHRDDYYIIAVLTGGSADVEIDFEKKELKAGEILIVSPWQIHQKPAGELWLADGWMLAFSPELLSDQEAQNIEEYSVSPFPFSPEKDIIHDIETLFLMSERNEEDRNIFIALVSALKTIILSTLDTTQGKASERYRAITVELRKLLDVHLRQEKSPSAYASMLNITEVYLNEAVKGATGLSAGAYIRYRVMTQARRLLAFTSKSSKEIAYTLGYADYPYFSKLFRKCVGLSPAEYRKNLK